MTNSITRRDRLEAAIQGEVADRPPVSLWRHFPVDDQTPISLAQSTALFQQQYDFDFVKVTPASSFCLLDWGVSDAWHGNTEGTRDYTRRVIAVPEDWHGLRTIAPDEGGLGRQLECLRELRNALGEDIPVIQTVFSPLAQAKNLAGQDRLLEHLHRSPEAVLDGLRVITDSTAAWVDQLHEESIDGVFYAIQHASYRYFDRDGYARFGERFDLEILDRTSDFWLNVLHLHGEAIHFELAERYPVQVVNWHDREVDPDLVAGSKRFPGAVCGGVRRDTLVYGEPEDVAREAKQALMSCAGKGVVLGTGCVTPIIAPRVNLQALRDTVNFA
jgi:uroporphyrinogen decarboxylase